jgi:hypothetical protein
MFDKHGWGNKVSLGEIGEKATSVEASHNSVQFSFKRFLDQGIL